MRVLLIGPLPKPWGGVAVHVQRLLERLLEEGVRVRFWDERLLRGRWAERAVLAPEPLVHYHGHSWGARARLAWASLLGKGVIFTVHSLRKPPPERLRRRWEFRLMLERGVFIATATHVAQKLKGLGAKRVFEVSSYIRPKSFPPPHRTVKKFAEEHSPLVLTVAHNLRPGTRQRDFYGVLDALDAAEKLRGEFRSLGLLIYLSEPGPLFAELEKRLKPWVLLRLGAPEPSWSALGVADALVRATESDTTAISLLEAAEAGVPAVASNAVPRPPGVYLYEVGDPAALAAVLGRALRERGAPEKPEDSFPQVLKVYRHCLMFV